MDLTRHHQKEGRFKMWQSMEQMNGLIHSLSRDLWSSITTGTGLAWLKHRGSWLLMAPTFLQWDGSLKTQVQQ